MSLSWILFVVVASPVAVVAASYLVEALRPAQTPPGKLTWAPDIPILYADIRGVRIRYIKTGAGPTLVLLHTLRTQLDLFEKVVPELAKSFTVYALDYPGHGYSGIPKARYDAKGHGMARSSLLGWIITMTSQVPLFGETVMRLRTFIIMKAVLRGGVANPASIRPALLKEMYEVGNRHGHYHAFISLLRNSASWEVATTLYGKINLPVLLIWGEQDWARSSEREHDRGLISG
jgi:pimeloyl-ACP methyl ester carboxylesterase